MSMKYFICFLFLTIFFPRENLFAQKIAVKKDTVTATIESDGTIYSVVKTIVGYIKLDNSIENSGHFIIGYLMPNGDILNDSNVLVGYMEADGTVRNSKQVKLGTILDDGTVLDAKNRTICTAKGIKKEWLAVVCFFFEE